FGFKCSFVKLFNELRFDNTMVQDTICSKANSSLALEVINDQQHHVEIDSKILNEGLDPSPNKNAESCSFTVVGHSCDVVEQAAPSLGAQNIGVEETNVIADEDVEESAQCSSDSENASEIADVSASESANGEECSPDDPDDEVRHVDNDNKGESEAEADSITDVHETEGATLASVQFLQTAKPLVVDIPKSLRSIQTCSEIFYGTDSFYLLFRLHMMLYERMQSAKFHSMSPENKWKILNDAQPGAPYAKFKEALYNLLNGSSDNTKFEDECRAIVGAQSYILFTLDKLIHKLIKQIQMIATEDSDGRVLQLHSYERYRNCKTFSDAVYHENARFLIPDDNLYRLEHIHSQKRMTVQLLKNDHDKPQPTAASMDPSFASYLNHELLSVVVPRTGENPGMIMERHVRRQYPGDEYSAASKAMEGVVVYNGLEMKFNCNTSKVSYVLDTKDFLYRRGRAKRALHENCNY
ncbi:hypothetical protein M569_09548, partial [Genlisea aurea]